MASFKSARKDGGKIKLSLLTADWWGTPKFKSNVQRNKGKILKFFKDYSKVILVETKDGYGGTIAVFHALNSKYHWMGYLNVDTMESFNVDEPKVRKDVV